MSAQQIPNLLTLRGGGRSRGGRGRGRGDIGASDHGVLAASRKDLDIQSTDTDAAVSRLSAVSLEYLNDQFARFFVNGTGTRRLPIINRGTYTRTTALDILIDAFLAPTESNYENSQQTKQIISLGAGTDTRYFRLRSQNKHHNIIYHEFDFPSVSLTKWRIVSNNQVLAQGGENESPFQAPQEPLVLAPEWGFTRSKEGSSETIYCCHPMDLRQLPTTHIGSRTIESFHGIRTDIPTLIISECCLCYLDVDKARDVVKWFADRIPSLGMILYEPIGVDDSFGQMMVANLAARNITMPTLKEYKTVADQKKRLVDLGFKGEGDEAGQEAETIENIWNGWIPPSEKERVDRLEGLDEVEEWQMLARHYCVAWGWRGQNGWEGWIGLRQQSR